MLVNYFTSSLVTFDYLKQASVVLLFGFKSNVGKFFDILEIIDIRENDDYVDDEVEVPENFQMISLIFICCKCPFGQLLSLFYF